MSTRSKSLPLQYILKKYIPQCDKQHHITLRFGSIKAGDNTIVQLPIESSLLSRFQSQIQSNEQMKKEVTNSWRIYANGYIYEHNTRTGECIRQQRILDMSYHIGNIIANYEKIEDDSSVFASVSSPNMEEEIECITYISSESGLNDIEWHVEKSSLLNTQRSLYCVIKKPVQLNKLWKQLESFGLI